MLHKTTSGEIGLTSMNSLSFRVISFFRPHHSMHRIIVKASDGNLGKGKITLATELIHLILGVHIFFYNQSNPQLGENLYYFNRLLPPNPSFPPPPPPNLVLIVSFFRACILGIMWLEAVLYFVSCMFVHCVLKCLCLFVYCVTVHVCSCG